MFETKIFLIEVYLKYIKDNEEKHIQFIHLKQRSFSW